MNTTFKKVLAGTLFCALSSLSTGFAGDNAHFYKPASYRPMNHKNLHNWDTIIDLAYGYGNCEKGRNGGGHKRNALDIYGTHNIAALGSEVPRIGNPGDFQNVLLAQGVVLDNNTPADSPFGHVSFEGKFQAHEINLNVKQHLNSNFFVAAHLPLRSLSVNDISLVDQSPTIGLYSQQTAEWVQIKNNLNAILNAYGYKNYDAKQKTTGLGDLCIVGGWERSDVETFDFFSYLNVSMHAGLLLPTGSNQKRSHAFSFATGNNGHWGVPVNFHMCGGVAEWASIGIHTGAIFFFDKTVTTRLKTDVSQSGFLKLAQGDAKEQLGSLWDFGIYAKFEHFFKGFSASVGYAFNAQEETELHAKDQVTFNDVIINTDERLKKWNAHTLHAQVEYDFAEHLKNSKYSPRLGVFFDVPVAGKRMFNTFMIGANVGADLHWDF